MKKLLLLTAAITAITVFACKNKTEEPKTPEQKKAETIVKSDKEKADSVKKYWEDKMKAAPDSLPEMKQP